MKHFKITHQNNGQRIGELVINNKKLETPFFYPVVSFFCGGTWKTKFGGGIYRQIKEKFLMNEKFKECFSGIMTSIAQINDFNITKRKLEEYTSKSIHEWFGFDGVLFVDSGGFKFLTNGGIKGVDFEIKNAEEVLYLQQKFGADILVSLDYPISPKLPKNETEKRIEFSINNAIFLLENKPKNALTYIAIHGYSKQDLMFFINKVLDGIEKNGYRLKNVDGIALGSLVPIKSDVIKIIDIIKTCKEVLNEYNMSILPIHVFGISSSLIPILITLGIDTFDSVSYIQSAINGKCFINGFKKVGINEIKTDMCNCPICSEKNNLELMKNCKKVDSIVGSLISMHNLATFAKEIQILKNVIKNYDEDQYINFVKKRYKHSKTIIKGICYIIRNWSGGQAS